jgi:hypothetical protein
MAVVIHHTFSFDFPSDGAMEHADMNCVEGLAPNFQWHDGNTKTCFDVRSMKLASSGSKEDGDGFEGVIP